MYSHFNYIPHNKAARKAAKATLGYNETRKGKDGEDIERKLFGNTGPLIKEQAEWLIEHASKNTYFFRWILSPDPNGENGEKDLDLWQLARDGVAWLEERLKRQGGIQLIGAEHNDHTGIPHIHAILLIERRGRELILNKKDIEDFRRTVHAMALNQKRQREQMQQQKAEMMLQSDSTRRLIGPHRTLIRQEPEPSREVVFGTNSGICQVCKGEKERELRDAGMDHCPACGRELGLRKEAALSL
ncbi:MAG: hypothetical protein ACJ8AI_09200 [Rhodopila sp.]